MAYLNIDYVLQEHPDPEMKTMYSDIAKRETFVDMLEDMECYIKVFMADGHNRNIYWRKMEKYSIWIKIIMVVDVQVWCSGHALDKRLRRSRVRFPSCTFPLTGMASNRYSVQIGDFGEFGKKLLCPSSSVFAV